MKVTFRCGKYGQCKVLKGSGPLVVGHLYREVSRWVGYDTSIGRFCGEDDCTHRTKSAAMDAAEHFYRSRDFCMGGCGLMIGEWNIARNGGYCAACAADFGIGVATERVATDAITGGYADLLEVGQAY